MFNGMDRWWPHAQSAVLIEVGQLQPRSRDIAGHIVEFGKDVTLLAQLLVGLDGGEEMGMPAVYGAADRCSARPSRSSHRLDSSCLHESHSGRPETR